MWWTALNSVIIFAQICCTNVLQNQNIPDKKHHKLQKSHANMEMWSPRSCVDPWKEGQEVVQWCMYTLDQNDGIFLEFVVLCCSLMSHTSYSTKLLEEPMFCEMLATYSLKTYHTNTSPWLWISSCFRVLSTMGANLCRVVLTRNVKTTWYQLLLEEEMIPNAGKDFG